MKVHKRNFKREEAAILETRHGGVAQLGEHLPCTQGVRSSILLISTSRLKGDRTERVKQRERLEKILTERHERVQREKGIGKTNADV